MTCRITKAALERYRSHASEGRVVVFDTETTGISATDEIVQIAAVEYVRGERTRSFVRYVVPSCEINPRAEAVHHLSRAFLEKNGVAPAVALREFFDFVGNDVLVVAHNVRFDYGMVRHMIRKFECPSGLTGLRYCDTIALAKKLVPGLEHYRLGLLIAALGLEGSNSHDALDDTLACGALFFDLVRRIPVEGEYAYEPVFD